MQESQGRTRAAAFVFLSVSGLWLLWSGHFTFTHGLLVILGVLSAVLVTYLCWRMDLLDDEAMPLPTVARGSTYLPWLTYQIVLSSYEVLSRGLTGNLDPRVLHVQGSQKTDLGLVIYANSLTLTPGTVSIDTDQGGGQITAHALSQSAAEDLESGDMDRRVTRVEGKSQ